MTGGTIVALALAILIGLTLGALGGGGSVLTLTVNPGFGHPSFIHTTLPKIRRVRQMIEQIKPGCDLAVDGGIDATTAPLAVDAGANVLVAGSSIFGDSEGVLAAMERLQAAIEQMRKALRRSARDVELYRG